MKHISHLIFILFSVLTIYSCSSSTTPIIDTKQVTGTNFTEAISGGIVTTDGGDPISAKGICMSNAPGPTVNDRIIQAATDDFVSNISGLDEGATVYVRAFATNLNGTSYGSEVEVHTWKLRDTKWAFLLNYDTNNNNYPGDVDFFADGTTMWDEPSSPGTYTTLGTWSVTEDKVHYYFQGDTLASSYIFTGTVVLDSTMNGVFTWGTNPDKTFTATKY